LAKDLLKNHQVIRSFLYCFLTDGQRFQFFKAERLSDGFAFQQSSVFTSTKGWQILLGFLRSDFSVLGYEALSVEGVSNLEYLGRGGSCVAFKGELDSGSGKASASSGDAVVVKVFNDAEAMTNEQRMLDMLSRPSQIKNVPKCLGVFPVLVDGQASTKTAMVCSPVGDAVLPITKGKPTRGCHLSDLVTILEEAHARGIVHRDIKPGNIFLVDGTVLLSDWGISCRNSDELIRWRGTVAYCDPPTRDAYAGGMHYPKPAADLRSLVRCAYAMMFQETDFPRDMDYWTDRLASGLWKACMDAAERLEYDTLRHIFQELRC
jgi:hypothetical protein